MVPWVGLWCVIVVYSDHTHLLFERITYTCTGVLDIQVITKFPVGSLMSHSELLDLAIGNFLSV